MTKVSCQVSSCKLGPSPAAASTHLLTPCSGDYFKVYFHDPTPVQIATMVAILEVGAFISSLVVGRVGDIIGRRKTIFYGSCIFFVGGAMQSFAVNMIMMMVGRVLAGLGVGMLSTIVPVYQSEISPPPQPGPARVH